MCKYCCYGMLINWNKNVNFIFTIEIMSQMILFSPNINPGKFCIRFRLPHLQHQCCCTRQQLESEQKRDANCMLRMVCRSIKMWTLSALAWAGREKCCFLFMTKIIIFYVIHGIESTTKYYQEGFVGSIGWLGKSVAISGLDRTVPTQEQKGTYPILRRDAWRWTVADISAGH